jgi:hypothetical protein
MSFSRRVLDMAPCPWLAPKQARRRDIMRLRALVIFTCSLRPVPNGDSRGTTGYDGQNLTVRVLGRFLAHTV